MFGNQCIQNTVFLFTSVEPFPNIVPRRQIFDMKAKALLLISLIAIVTAIASPTLMPIANTQDVSDVKVLMLICDGFGWNYFDAKERLEDWGVNITTISNSLDTNVSSCINRPENWTIADLLLKDVDDDIASQFDVLFIPSGGQWLSLISSTRVRNFISNAYELGLIISTLCIGNRVLSESNNIVNGTNVASYVNTNTYMFIEGAIVRYGVDVVSDNRIITGGTGGGLSEGGYTEAPTSEVCMAMIKEALGMSYVKKASISPLSGEIGTNFTISVDVDDMDEEFGNLVSVDTNISDVVAKIYTKENRTFVASVQLEDDDMDSKYSGSFIATSVDEYVVDIEVEDTNSTLEIERELVGFIIGEQTSTTTITTTTNATTSITETTAGFNLLLLGAVGLSGLSVIVIIAIIIKKR